MGWASGSMLAESLWREVRRYVPEDRLREVAQTFISEFESFDCDTLDEAQQLIVDAGYYIGDVLEFPSGEVHCINGDQLKIDKNIFNDCKITVGRKYIFEVLQACIVVGVTPSGIPVLRNDRWRLYLATPGVELAND